MRLLGFRVSVDQLDEEAAVVVEAGEHEEKVLLPWLWHDAASAASPAHWVSRPPAAW